MLRTSERTECPRGHQLVEPNLVRAHLARGHRSCLACSRTQAQLRYKKSWPDYSMMFERLADQKHREIMENFNG